MTANCGRWAKKVERVIVPAILMILTYYEVKQLRGIYSMNKLEDNLFRDVGLLKIIGFTAREIKEGFCNRGKRKPPMHRDTLSDFLSKDKNSVYTSQGSSMEKVSYC